MREIIPYIPPEKICEDDRPTHHWYHYYHSHACPPTDNTSDEFGRYIKRRNTARRIIDLAFAMTCGRRTRMKVRELIWDRLLGTSRRRNILGEASDNNIDTFPESAFIFGSAGVAKFGAIKPYVPVAVRSCADLILLCQRLTTWIDCGCVGKAPR